MVRVSGLAIYAMLAVAIGASSAGAAEECHLHPKASLPMDIDASGRVTVPMTFDGHQLKMLVDTGGVYTEVGDATVKALGLRTEVVQSVTLSNGDHMDQAAKAQNVALGQLRAAHWDFLVTPPGDMLAGVDGVVGPDVLKSYDADFDFANAKLTLFSQDHCTGKVVYWTGDDHAAIPFNMDDNFHITAEVLLDGKPVKALIDTGAWRSVLDLEKARDLFGIKENDPSLKRDQGDSNGYTYPFKEISLQGDSGSSLAVKAPQLLLLSEDKLKLFKLGYNQPKLMIGMDVLRHLHLYIAYGERMLYITPASAH